MNQPGIKNSMDLTRPDLLAPDGKEGQRLHRTEHDGTVVADAWSHHHYYFPSSWILRRH